MSGRSRRRRLTKDRLYTIGNSLSLRWAGVKGKQVFVEIATYDQPMLTIVGAKRGRIEIPVADIRRIRVGIEFERFTRYRCMIFRKGGGTVRLDGTFFQDDYRALVLHLAEEMGRLGRGDRIDRGVEHWTALGHLLIFSAPGLLVSYTAYYIWGDRMWELDREDYMLAGLGLVPAWGLIVFALYYYVRWHFPRRARDMDAVRRMLP